MEQTQTERGAPLTEAERAEAIGPYTLEHLLEAHEADLLRLAAPGEAPPKLQWDDGEPWLDARMNLIKSQPGWWLGLERLASGFLVMDLVREVGFSVHVLTKGPRRTAVAWSEKLLWCQRHIAHDVDITITHDKGMVYGRVLCDDYPLYMERWLKYRPRGLGLMPETEYNRGYTHPNVIKYPADLQVGDQKYCQLRAALITAFTR